ncbi:hypothetical protein PHYBLDRAFT_73109 [Phycomyces blakesleeanus NRRL 1555(-)]|uniref:Uncharacterized protein n=1 Tax=Phycomyces blakesleeanus (strain ATCC 8743b / DSM 1359 / FGSC 10004 / NBRC 33097 / NRRL 1555) TaxID=763407 RepID=A0A167MFI3_PHYB8|nr:hypothetical protein PHYBLDRAFT_73109 [Phycomyces blakesleeanus NRRL 1555(-)]OAD72706.1 hypothetical protein PHYBLDRAFT_73109 [Phycomyces blakesleeanus NRRL 1555(-)]|eukprot:XP_018290746.1 hypothetical protein PHYBLDRAFT_73109 [Phycomyces blakesleeanus NRRL 1555(-)]
MSSIPQLYNEKCYCAECSQNKLDYSFVVRRTAQHHNKRARLDAIRCESAIPTRQSGTTEEAYGQTSLPVWEGAPMSDYDNVNKFKFSKLKAVLYLLDFPDCFWSGTFYCTSFPFPILLSKNKTFTLIMSSNRTNFSINEINDDHMIRIAPNYKSSNPKETETFANEEVFSFYFKNLAKRHSTWNITNTHISWATSTASPKDVVKTVYFVCNHQGLPKKVKLVEDAGNQKAKRVQTESIKDGCKAKITKMTLQNGNVVVDYLWQHATHQPEKVQDMVCSRLPAELEVGLGVSSFLTSLHIKIIDVQNVINAGLNKLSRKNAIDKASVEQ